MMPDSSAGKVHGVGGRAGHALKASYDRATNAAKRLAVSGKKTVWVAVALTALSVAAFSLLHWHSTRIEVPGQPKIHGHGIDDPGFFEDSA